MDIVIGADPWGAELKDIVKEHLETQGHTVIDVGTVQEDKVDYYNVSVAAAKKIQAGQAERGILFCGTGMGVALVANKFKGIYASVVESEFTARMCRAINNANVMTIGAMIVAPHKALRMVDAFLSTTHTQDIDKDIAGFLVDALKQIESIEADNMASLQE